MSSLAPAPEATTTPRPAGTPLLSVVVLTYRRREELARTLDSVRTQTYRPLETIVVDNNSGDGTADFVAENYPEARLLRITENLGAAGRNRGVEAARGEYVVMIDNDVRFEAPDELDRVAAAFAERPRGAVLVFKILGDSGPKLHLRDWCHPRAWRDYSDRRFETYYIAEGACAFRREDYLKLGGYYEPFWIGGEGWDLALRVLNEGWHIEYRPEIRVRHAMAPETRSGRRPYYYYIRNAIWTGFKDYRGPRRWGFLSYHMAKMLFFCLKQRQFGDFVRGVRDGWGTRRELVPTPIRPEVWRRLRELNRERPGWWTRLRTHWAQDEV